LPLTIWGLIGARLWHILTPPLSSVQLGLTTHHYLSHPLDVLAVWVGGFGIPGAILGGTIALFVFSRNNQLSFWALADILAPGIALAQVIGRLTNYFNQELYGLPTNLSWAVFIEPSYRLIGYEAIERYHPLFAYEMILNLINLILILWLGDKYFTKLKTGHLFLIYLTFYSVARFCLEFLRLDVSLIHNININQVFFALLFLFISALFFKSHRLNKDL
jgi:phosphatidylglycerol:prolipoprotein diacylglycerol transferase